MLQAETQNSQFLEVFCALRLLQKKKVGMHRATSINHDPLGYQRSRRDLKQQSHTMPRGELASLAKTPSWGPSPVMDLCVPDMSCVGENGLGIAYPKPPGPREGESPTAWLSTREEPKGFGFALHLRCVLHQQDG